MNQNYNQKYTREQIESILSVIHDCVRCDRYIIAKKENQKENIDFLNNYNLNTCRQKDILLCIKTDDFCHSLKNMKVGYEHEVLYAFCPQVGLVNFEGEEKLVDVYTKQHH